MNPSTFEKVQAVLVLWERPLWWASLYSRALTTICVDEVPAPRSRPTTVRQGNGGLQLVNYIPVTSYARKVDPRASQGLGSRGSRIFRRST